MAHAASREELDLSKNESSFLLVWGHDSVSGWADWTVMVTGSQELLLVGTDGSRLTYVNIVECDRWREWLGVYVCGNTHVCVHSLAWKHRWSSIPAYFVSTRLWSKLWEPGTESSWPPLCPQGFVCCQAPVQHFKNIYWIKKSWKGIFFFFKNIEVVIFK